MSSRTERSYRGIKKILRQSKLIPIDLLRRKKYLEVILRKL